MVEIILEVYSKQHLCCYLCLSKRIFISCGLSFGVVELGNSGDEGLKLSLLTKKKNSDLMQERVSLGRRVFCKPEHIG